MDEMSIREVINVVESLQVGDGVVVEDEHGDEYSGEVVETQRGEQERRWLVKGDDDTDDHVLHIYYDIEGGPVTVHISFEDETENRVVSASGEN